MRLGREGAFQRNEVGGVDLRVWGRVCEIVRRMWDGLFGSGGFEKLGWGGGVNVRWGVGVRTFVARILNNVNPMNSRNSVQITMLIY